MNISLRTAALLFIVQAGFAQGVLPPRKAAVPQDAPIPNYLLISNSVPESLSVTHTSGEKRTLLSYKPANDEFVIGFFSPNCDQNVAQWKEIKRIYEEYKGWHVTFLAVSVQSNEAREDLAKAMAHAELPFTVVRDADGQLARQLHATVVPEVMVIDEWGYLIYRGGLKDVRGALDSAINHEGMTVEAEGKDLQGCAIQ